MSHIRLDEYGFGLSWSETGIMRRTGHALAHGGRFWLVDPYDAPEALDGIRALGEPAGVIQLLDRHNRDAAELASRLGVPHLRLPDAVPGSPFRSLPVVRLPRWHERALWWPEQRALVVADALGTSKMYVQGDRDVGVHPFLRLRPPGALKRCEPEHLLLGHGPPVHGPHAARAVRRAYGHALRDLPEALVRLPFSFDR